MPVWFFHQNMRLFGGGVADRNSAYLDAFSRMVIPGNPIAVAGFTEIVNHSTAPVALHPLSQTLLGGKATLIITACGQTSLSAGPEFIGIAVHEGLPIYAIGRILFQSDGQDLQLTHDVSPFPPDPGWLYTLPDSASMDYRGLVYVVVEINGVHIAIGFLHNLYTFEAQRALVRSKIPAMFNLMAFNPILPGTIPFIGGDFNLPPAITGTYRTGRGYPYDAGPTTAAGNTYDYWYAAYSPEVPSPDGLITPKPAADFSTLAPLMSDHAAVLLQIM